MPSTYMRCVARFWYHLHSLKNVKNTHGRVLILVTLQAKACNCTKINTLPWVFFTFLKLYKWYHIVQRITYILLTISKFHTSFLFCQNFITNVANCLKMPKNIVSQDQTVFCELFRKAWKSLLSVN